MGLACSILIIGFLFKFLIRSVSNNLLSIGIYGLTIMAVVAGIMFFFRHKGKSQFYSTYFKRTIPILLIGLFSYLLPFDTLIAFKYRNHPKYAQLLKQSIRSPNNQELLDKLQKERERIY